MTATSPNFALLDVSRPEVARLIAAMVQARDAVKRRSWSHPREPTGEEWWADVLADPNRFALVAIRPHRWKSVRQPRAMHRVSRFCASRR
jgi:hypothetical protein